MSRGRIPRWVVQESESENGEQNKEVEEEEVDRELGDDVTHDLGAPFTVYEAVVELYKSIIKRKTTPPIIVNFEFWKGKMAEGDRFARNFVRLLQRLRLEKWIGITECAYPKLMHEFYTTVSISSDGTIECRFGGRWCKFTKYDIIDAFDFYASGGEKEGGRPDIDGIYKDCDEEYDEVKFWDELKCKDIGDTQGFPLTAVQDNAVYLAY
ncbi:hypothetical protein CASFOL_034633 [Castilleja foliolosa]|uniref:Uncharacterized protein n=1 Tax=Castilleja foliolosa TaxID=1961234 RepID=A0ABD3BRV9_9LAMI